MVLNIGAEIRFFCYVSPVDMRKGISSLYNLIKINNSAHNPNDPNNNDPNNHHSPHSLNDPSNLDTCDCTSNEQANSLSVLDGDAFIFIGSTQKSIKILMWHKNGFILYHKRLELGRYSLPRQKSNDPFFELTTGDVDRLLTHIQYRTVVNELKLKIISTL